MLTIRQLERRLAVVANWALFGSFGLGLIQSGGADGRSVLGLIGFALIIVGFIAQVIINRIFGGGFTSGEIALGFSAFGVALIGFVARWLFDPGFTAADAVIGLAGFAAIIASFIAYIVLRYGLKGSFSMFHQLRGD